MKAPWKNSISTRILILFVFFSTMMTVGFGVTVIVLEYFKSEEIFNHILKYEYSRFIKNYSFDSSIALPETEYMKFYIGIENVPYPKQRSVAKLEPGYYETGFPIGIDGPGNYHVAVQPLPGRKDMLYIVLDRDVTRINEHTLEQHMFPILIIVCILTFFLGRVISNRVSRPLKQLVTMVDQSEPGNLPSGFSQLFSQDEVGTLAKALEKSMERVKAFLTREQQFTRDASHELRTPVTVIKGAVELLQQTPSYEEKTVNRLVKRIDESVADIESAIEALLWLSREETASGFDQVCEIVPVVEDIVEQNQKIYAAKAIDVDIEAQGNPAVKSPVAVLRITLFNLIRNAFQFTNEGNIHIRISKFQVEITDTGSGIAPDEIDKVQEAAYRGKTSQGFGFGLDIVKRLSDRFGWRLEIESTAGKGTTARLILENLLE
ncbi:MAG: HAMP domain-containing histidine kinase [Proteobacteria bacterium]|nr:HAMP domain-containing histidine kinase [Pseudomonadota bacterium]